MSSKYKRPKKAAEPIDPEKMKVRRGEIINFMNFMSMDENFCLRVWNTVQAVYKREQEKAEAAGSIEGDVSSGQSAQDEQDGVQIPASSDPECQPAEAVPA